MRTPLAVRSSTARAKSASSKTQMSSSCAPGAMSCTISATAVPWSTGGNDPSGPLPSKPVIPGPQWLMVVTLDGSSLPSLDWYASKPTSTTATLTPAPVCAGVALCHACAPVEPARLGPVLLTPSLVVAARSRRSGWTAVTSGASDSAARLAVGTEVCTEVGRDTSTSPPAASTASRMRVSSFPSTVTRDAPSVVDDPSVLMVSNACGSLPFGSCSVPLSSLGCSGEDAAASWVAGVHVELGASGAAGAGAGAEIATSSTTPRQSTSLRIPTGPLNEDEPLRPGPRRPYRHE